tara:strand:+ start:864 stop:1343 length:480 start_codon:yes stop_codon:yes gene_type:complete
MLGCHKMNVYSYKPEDEKLYNNFIKKVNIGGESECWTWSAAINKVTQRPMFWFQGKWTPAARASMYFKQGYLTDGLHVCHDPITCNNTLCLNPFHLREDTPSANTRDLLVTGNHNNKRKTHCPQEHEYSEENTYYYKNKRFCKICKVEQLKNIRRKKEK